MPLLSRTDGFPAPRAGSFRRGFWLPALAASGLDVHLHDLRHAGNVLVAQAGANLRELMERMGHSTSDRQHQRADAVAARVQSELGPAGNDAR